MTTSLLDISLYKTKLDYPPDLQQFCTTNGVTLPGIDTFAGQAYALMAQPEVRAQKHLGREETALFFTQIGMNTKDSIQPFNKAKGLKRMNVGRGNYCLAYPFETDLNDIAKRKGAVIGGDKNTCIELIKSWWKKNLVDVPNDEWQTGHLDPNGDASETNLAWQPPLQAKYRNRFKWDSLFHKMWPTGDEVCEKMNDYYTETEQKKMLAALKAKWEK